jgi:H+/Cl- antiporter ClcA
MCARPSLTAILLLFELTHDYRIILPLMGTVGVASWVAAGAFTRPLFGLS